MQTKNPTTSILEKHIQFLVIAELQFRIISVVRLAVNENRQPLDLPREWTHGQHRVRYEDIALSQDQAVYAASFLHQSATFMMAVAIKDSIEAIAPGLREALNSGGQDAQIRDVILKVEPKPWILPDEDVVNAYQIARLVRNAFSHAPFNPTWMIPDKLQGKIIAIPNVITLDTANLHRKPLDSRHYGGPLALFWFCTFVRTQILGDELTPRQVIPSPENQIHQGDIILTKVDEIPPGPVPVVIQQLPEGGIPLGGGHVLYPKNIMGEGDVIAAARIMKVFSSAQELVEPGETALFLFTDGRFFEHSDGAGSSGFWRLLAPERPFQRVIVFRWSTHEGRRHVELFTALPDGLIGPVGDGPYEGRYTVRLRELRLAGTTSSTWEGFVGTDEFPVSYITREKTPS